MIQPFSIDENAEPQENAKAFLNWVISTFVELARVTEENNRYLAAIYRMLVTAMSGQQPAHGVHGHGPAAIEHQHSRQTVEAVRRFIMNNQGAVFDLLRAFLGRK